MRYNLPHLHQGDGAGPAHPAVPAAHGLPHHTRGYVRVGFAAPTAMYGDIRLSHHLQLSGARRAGRQNVLLQVVPGVELLQGRTGLELLRGEGLELAAGYEAGLLRALHLAAHAGVRPHQERDGPVSVRRLQGQELVVGKGLCDCIIN